jgi:hypothetical protein
MPATMISPAAQSRLRALSRATEVRTGRAQLRRDIRAGKLTVSDILGDIPNEAATMQVVELLMFQRGWGRVRSRKLLKNVPVAENKALCTLTQRQLDLIVSLLG